MNNHAIIIFVALSLAGLAIRLTLPRILAWRGVWFTWHTRFGPALVFDSADADGTTVRLLNVNGTYQSVCYVDDDLLWDPVCEYHRSWAKVVHDTWPLRRARGRGVSPAKGQGLSPTGEQTFSPANEGQAEKTMPSRRALVMGGGGYSFPKWIVAYRPDFACEVVEIDPAITRIARERFFLTRLEEEFDTRESGRLVLVEDDAWEHLRRSQGRYELIVNDAFSGNRPLGPMGTAEGARLVRERLTADGVYVGNVRTPLEGPRSRTLREAQGAFEREFAHVQIIPERPEEPRKKGNNALIAWGIRDSSTEGGTP